MGVAARLTAYALALVLVSAVAWFAGGLVGPAAGPPPGHDTGGDHDVHGSDAESATDGLASAVAGYRLAVVDTPTFVPGTRGELRFTVIGPDGLAVTAFIHPHPIARSAAVARRWSSAATPRASSASTRPWARTAPGARRCGCPRRRVGGRFVDATPTAGPTVVLGVDLFAAGPFEPFTFPPSRTAAIGDSPAPPRRPTWCRGVPSQVFRHRRPRRRGRHRAAALPRCVRQARRAPRGRRPQPTPPPRAGLRSATARARRSRSPSASERRDLPHSSSSSAWPTVMHTRGVHRADEEPMSTPDRPDHRRHDLASCANRVEAQAQRARRRRGTTVNYATEKAHVHLPGRARPRRRSWRRWRPRATRRHCPRPIRSRRPTPPAPLRQKPPSLGRHGPGRAGGRAVHGPRTLHFPHR
jgi:hypothetical protein